MKYICFACIMLIFLQSCSKDSSPLVVEQPLALTFSTSPIDLQGIAADFAADIAYDDHERNVFDIFLAAADDPTPLVIYIHGGGFTGGDKSEAYSLIFTDQIREFLRNGVSFATLNYRLLDGVDTTGVFKSLRDSRRCLQFIRHYARDLNIDAHRVALYGASAGAGTSLWLGLHDDMSDAQNSDPVLRQSTRIAAVGAYETQATYDLVRWETDVFVSFGITLEIAASLGAEAQLLSFYGIDSLPQLYTPAIAAYRSEVDMLALMDSGDPDIWVQNMLSPATFPLSVFDFLHHPFHARQIKTQADSVGTVCHAYIPPLGISDPANEDLVAFFLRKLNVIAL